MDRAESFSVVPANGQSSTSNVNPNAIDPEKLLPTIKKLRNPWPPTPQASTRAVITDIAAWHNTNYDEVLSKKRNRNIVRARHAAIRRLKELHPNWSSPYLGAIFQVDHTTCLWVLGRTKKGKARFCTVTPP